MGQQTSGTEERRAGDSGRSALRWAMSLAAVGVFVMYQSVETTPAAPRSADNSPAAVASATPTPAALPTRTAPATHTMARSKPVKLRIPQLFVEAPFTELGLTPTGGLAAPPADDRNLVGWYKDGPTPGERGPAVVAGHVDTTKGPAVFLMLYVLRPGNPVEITRADGSVAVFTVDSVQTFAKNAFPDKLVYGDTPDAQLRLITCAGEYNRATHDYSDNVVVFAHLSATRPA
ncbi:sortase family protein [Streptomyces sp. TLI_235]|nr:class F sortase [Streptomyces sp. TLI_235]PBC79976.1 sortase family protein [Streptomyces sp. TLI_235]